MQRCRRRRQLPWTDPCRWVRGPDRSCGRRAVSFDEAMRYRMPTYSSDRSPIARSHSSRHVSVLWRATNSLHYARRSRRLAGLGGAPNNCYLAFANWGLKSQPRNGEELRKDLATFRRLWRWSAARGL
jgi:hypothetical protein